MSELRQKYSFSCLLKASGLPRSTYYYNVTAPDKDLKNQELCEEIKTVFQKNKGRYGYRRVTVVINHSETVNHKKIQRLMKKMGLKSPVRRSRYKSYRGEIGTTAPDRLKRNFRAVKPGRKAVTDVSEFHIAAGKLYLSPVLDLYNREILSYSISAKPDFHQTLSMLNRAIPYLADNAILHSDQGWQYQMRLYGRILKENHIRQSMSRKGNCLDNSVMENFFGIMKSEMFYGHEYEFESLDQLKHSMEDYIDYYNNRRIKTTLKGMSPVEYRKHSCHN